MHKPVKLLHVVAARLSLLAAVVLAFWAVFFYFAMMDEINDEVDDSLEDYAETIILRSLRGEPLPSASSGSNNQFYLRPVSEGYARRHPHVRYEDREVYIKEKREREPARVLTYIFQRDDGRYMEIEVSTPQIDKADLRKAIFYWLIFLYGAILLCIVLAIVLGLRRSMRPLHRLLAWLDAYELGRRAEPLPRNTRIDEFVRLQEAVSRSMERSEASFRQQKEFIGNASHELQTPLAACRARIELLLDDETLSEAQMGELLKINRTLEGMTRLNRSLLLLCKIENGQLPAAVGLEVGAVAARLLPDYEAVFSHRHLAVSLRRHGPWRVQMDAGLADTLVGNLLKNAFVHNIEGGRVDIEVHPGLLRVANTGAPGPLDAQAVFTRFHHTPGPASTGLGLALAQAICRSYGFSIGYRYDNGLHVFEVTA